MKKIILGLILFVFCLIVPVSAEVVYPVATGFINDYAHVLSAQEKQELNQIATSLKSENGSELAVVTIKTVAPLESKGYAVGLFEKWGIGQKAHDNGVLLLVAIDERRVEIEVGYGLEGVLTDAACGKILDIYAVPNFRNGQMGKGIVESAKAIAQAAKGEEFLPVSESKSADAGFLPAWSIIFIAIALFGGAFYNMGKKRIILPTMFFGAAGALFGSLTGESEMIPILGGIFGFFGLIIGLAVKYGGTGGGGGSSSSGSSWSSGSSSSSSGGFSGGSSGGGGSGRSW